MGGKMLLGPDGFLYITLGDMTPSKLFNKIEKYKTKAQNYGEGVEVDGRAGILRITQDGKAVNGGILGNSYPANLYYAYGIKNSFGIGFDPVTGYLWDTENGPNFGDEINLVVPGFNGGWAKIQGFWRVSETLEKMEPVDSTNPSGLVDFGGKGKYHQPKLVWESDAGPTAIVFLNSTKLGSKYQNDMFVGAVKNGRIFSFEMNENRSDLTYTLLGEETEPSVTFAQGFGIVTDLQVGPYDGYLYVVSGDRVNKVGALYKILPK
jgi:glucose/arabinose dehydrogenase